MNRKEIVCDILGVLLTAGLGLVAIILIGLIK